MRAVLGGPLAGELVIGPMTPTPLEPDRWHREVIGAGVSATRHSRRTRSGWPVEIYVTPEGVLAFISFFEYTAVVTCAGELTGELAETLSTAEPDWRDGGQITAIAELFA